MAHDEASSSGSWDTLGTEDRCYNGLGHSTSVKSWSRVRNLLDLPVDILQMIVKEITHTNDLTSLALTNSTLHNLAVPLIYARFDIVWPDANMISNDTKSVDALTYGLSTLCLGNSFSFRKPRHLRGAQRNQCVIQRTNRMDYASYTKKFSLGNGPSDWISEYMITKESGKMLGTLVALAVRKMINLESFVWDMPTGILSDVFMALDSLCDHSPDESCKLEKVWVRWHDNSDIQSTTTASGTTHPDFLQPFIPPGNTHTPIGILLPSNTHAPAPRRPVPYSESRVEYPTFSVLPPLKSLTVLDIDELSYLDEMASLIWRSQGRLQELRVGIAQKAIGKQWVQAWDGPFLQQVDHNARWPGESSIGEKRLGGVLGVLVGRIFDIRSKVFRRGKSKLPNPDLTSTSQNGFPPAGEASSSSSNSSHNNPDTEALLSYVDAVIAGSQVAVSHVAPASTPSTDDPIQALGNLGLDDDNAVPGTQQKSTARGLTKGRSLLDGKLHLKILELERVPLSIQVCNKAIDWTTITTLTILNCFNHSSLWKMLHKQYSPVVLRGSHPATQYHLSLKNIHVDITTEVLVTFLRETLAPNSLEILFLQDRSRSEVFVPVKIEQIFRGPVKRHRKSLRKLLIDSSIPPEGGIETMLWKNWVLPTDMVSFLTSRRMPNLRELAVALDHRDWHTFLQRLPNCAQLRSLNIRNMANYVSATFDPKELAQQIVDIVTLCPDIKLCYIGIGSKCFEILEVRHPDAAARRVETAFTLTQAPITSTMAINAGEDADDDDEEEEDDQDDDDDGDAGNSNGNDGGEDDTSDDDLDGGDDTVANDFEGAAGVSSAQSGGLAFDGASSDDDDDISLDDDGVRRPGLRLREILFYDDKVAIFKARHGKL